MTEACYMCEDDGVTREHVPPKCLFPEAKDLDEGENYRVNLITVPSCKAHNTAKSKDDEYILFFLAANVVSNDLSKSHFGKKIMRAVNRKPHIFVEFAKKNTPVTLVGEDGKQINTIAIQIDRERFDSAIIHVAHGVYFTKFGERFTGDVSVFTEGLVDLNGKDSVGFNAQIQNLGKMLDEFLKSTKEEGDNPEVFTYQSVYDEKHNQTILRLNFYGEFKVTSFMKHS